MPEICSQITFFYYKNFERARDFYERIMGFELADDQGTCRIYRVQGTSFLGIVDEKHGHCSAPRSESNVLVTLATKVNGMSFAEKQKMIGKSVPLNTNSATATAPVESDGEYITYTVRYGDTIWDIVRMFDNVTTNQVLTLNNISDPGKIQVGQKLKIRKKS